MTVSSWKKMLKELAKKPAIREKYIKHNKPKERTTGISRKKCEKCGRSRGIINKYGINLCRQCFREIAEELGFKKYS